MALELDINLGVKAQGPQGIQGPAGKGFSVAKTYASVDAMNADIASLSDGDFVMIASSPEDPDNAKLFTKQGGEMKEVADLSGAQGIQGPAGPQGVAGKIYKPYVAENGDLHAKLINPDGTDATL
jgi:hypothetical protein